MFTETGHHLLIKMTFNYELKLDHFVSITIFSCVNQSATNTGWSFLIANCHQLGQLHQSVEGLKTLRIFVNFIIFFRIMPLSQFPSIRAMCCMKWLIINRQINNKYEMTTAML